MKFENYEIRKNALLIGLNKYLEDFNFFWDNSYSLGKKDAVINIGAGLLELKDFVRVRNDNDIEVKIKLYQELVDKWLPNYLKGI
ncbi:MAG: hypothetical protein AABW90_00855 [Nanoarchaeota archaeon]